MARLTKRPTIAGEHETETRRTARKDEPDLEVKNEGTIVVFTPQTDVGKHFLHEVLFTDPTSGLEETHSISTTGWQGASLMRRRAKVRGWRILEAVNAGTSAYRARQNVDPKREWLYSILSGTRNESRGLC